MLIGHAAPRAQFLDAWTTGRLHHAWLLAGPEGVGKRTFADAAARMMLADARGFEVADDHPAARLIEAGSHMDLRVLERAERARGVGLAAAISADQVRELQPLFQMTPGLGAWRVVIVDAIDDMNVAAANAFLKNLEEPPAQTVFLLISHAPGRLLPTIRSRCQRLRFAPLDAAATRAALEHALPDAEDLDELVELAEGAPGRAVAYAGLKIGELGAALDRLARAEPGPARALGLKLSAALAGKAAQPRYEAFLELAPRHIAARARKAEGAALARLLALWESAADLSASAVPLSLDPAAVTVQMAAYVSGQIYE